MKTGLCILAAVILALVVALAGCTGPQSRDAPGETVAAITTNCDIHFLNFRGHPFPVLIKRMDGPGHRAMMLLPVNPPMTKEQVLSYLERTDTPEIKAHILSDVPCGKYQIIAPTLGLIAEEEICDCKDGKYNVAFYLVPGNDQTAWFTTGPIPQMESGA